MPSLPRLLTYLGIAFAAIATGCAGGSVLPSFDLSPAGPAAATANLRLHLASVGASRRQLLYQAKATPANAEIVVDGIGLATPFSQVVPLTLAGSSDVTLAAVPTGSHMIISLQGLDGEDQPIAGSLELAATALQDGDNTVTLTPASSVAGRVAQLLLAGDRAHATAVLSSVSLGDLESAMAHYVRVRALPDFSLLDPAAIADAIASGAGVVPAEPTAQTARSPGTLVVQRDSWPTGDDYEVTVNDPISLPVRSRDPQAVVITPIAPGTWTVSVTDTTQAGPTQIAPVTITSGQATILPFALAAAGNASQELPPLPAALGAGGGAVVMVAGVERLFTVGGEGVNASGLAQHEPIENTASSTIWSYAPGTPMQQVTELAGSTPVREAAVAAQGSQLFWFGGQQGLSTTGNGWVYDASSTGAPAALPPMPGGEPFEGGSAATIGNLIYVLGVQDGQSTQLNAYDPIAKTWNSAELPSLPFARQRMAGAVLNGRWYLFGGESPDYAFFPFGSFQQPLAGGKVFDPAAPLPWQDIADMPTARAGAVAVAANGKIWVMGGVGAGDAPCNAVEVYDPATNSWSPRLPLKHARAFAAAGLLGGQILVAGGILGSSLDTELPVDFVESITP